MSSHAEDPSASLGLTPADIERLLADRSPTRRSEVAAKVATQVDAGRLNAAEMRLALDILRAMAQDAELVVRQSVAQALYKSHHMAHEIAVRFAHDDISIALPVLEHSPVLTDQDLIAVLADGNGQKQVAIARRGEVSEQLAAAVIETGNAAAIVTLVENEGADMSEDLFDRTLKRYGRFETVKSAMVHRSILPVTIAERLLALVSDRLKMELVTRHALPDGAASDVIVDARERATLDLIDEGGQQTGDTRALIRQLHARGRLTPSLMLRVLCTGDVVFVEEAFAHIAGITLDKASQLVHDGGPLGLKAIYKRCAFPENLFPAFRAAIDVFHETSADAPKDRKGFETLVVGRILAQYRDMEVGDLDYLLAKLTKLEAA